MLSPFFPLQAFYLLSFDADGKGRPVVVRNCVVDNGGINSETEIGRVTYCGWLRTIDYGGRRRRGCLLACDTDGCNKSSHPVYSCSLHTLQLITASVVTISRWFL